MGWATWKQQRMLRRLCRYAVILLTCMCLSGIGYAIVKSEIIKNAQLMGDALAHNYAAEKYQAFRGVEDMLEFSRQSIDRFIREGKDEAFIIRWIRQYHDDRRDVFKQNGVTPYVFVNGRELGQTGDGCESGMFSVGRHEKFTAVADEAGVAEAWMDETTGKHVISVARKCSLANIILAFDIISENILLGVSRVPLPENSTFFLCDGNGTLLFWRSDNDELVLDAPQKMISLLFRDIRAGKYEAADAVFSYESMGENYVYYSSMPNGWVGIVAIPSRELMEQLNTPVTLFVLFFIVSLLVIAFILWRNFLSDRAAEKMDETMRILGNTYYAMYRVNLSDGSYEMLKASPYVESKIGKSGDYGMVLQAAREVIEPEAREDFDTSFSLENIRKLVGNHDHDFGGDFRRLFGNVYKWVNVRVLFDADIAPGEVVLCFREVEKERMRRLREHELLKSAMDAAKRNEKSKQAFFNRMSHDMRTPLNGIIGLSELVRKNVDDREKVLSYMDKITYSSTQLLDLVNDILDMSRMEEGKVILNNGVFNIEECISSCAAPFVAQAMTEHKTFLVEFDIRNTNVVGDSSRLGQILNNLLSNAFKYSREGATINIMTRQIGNREHSQYQIVVSDTGMGMSAEFLEHIFEPYARETRFSSRSITGTGLGMAIVKNIVTQMSGQIQVTSELGRGTTFTVNIPFILAEEEEQKPLRLEETALFSFEGKRLLVAEDNMINMEIVTEMLSAAGAEIDQAWNGREAVEMFSASPLNGYDLILMDMQMPVMDGCAAAKAIRAMERADAATVPIIAVTANAFSEDIAATAASGMNSHISKPIDFKVLCEEMETLLPGRSVSSGGKIPE